MVKYIYWIDAIVSCSFFAFLIVRYLNSVNDVAYLVVSIVYFVYVIFSVLIRIICKAR